MDVPFHPLCVNSGCGSEAPPLPLSRHIGEKTAFYDLACAVNYESLSENIKAKLFEMD